ncbi:MAG: tetratricopeptide repeat protein, partial [Bradymonadia bacterium]
YQEEIAQILAPIYRESQQFEKLAVLMELQVQSANEMDQASLLRDSGLIRLRDLNDFELAQENILAAYRIDPTCPQTSDALFELIEQTEVNHEFADAIEKGLSQQEPSEEKRLRLLLVDWFSGPLESRSKVEAHLRAILEQEPEDVDVLTRLQLFFEDEERWEDVVDLIRLHIELSKDDAERVSLMISAGGISESYLSDTDTAVEFYQSAYDVDPQEVDVYERLEACLMQRQDFVRLSELLEERLERVYDTDTLIRIYDTLADIYVAELNQHDRAIEMIERRVEHQTDHASIEKLHGLYAQQGQWSELADSLVALCRHERDLDKLRGYLESLINVAENELVDQSLTRRSCEQWIEAGFPIQDVESRLASILQAQAEWSALVDLYERSLEANDRIEDQCRIRHRLIEIHLNEREDIEVASEHLEFVVEHDDSSASRRLLAQLKNRQGAFEEALSLLTGLTELSDVPDREMALIHRDIGKLWLDRNEEPNSALSAFEESFSLDGQVDTLRLLVEAARAVDDRETLLNALDSAVAFFEGGERLMTLREMIALRMERNDFEHAVPILEEVLADAPTDVNVIRQLIQCLETLGRTAELKRYFGDWVNDFGTKRMSGLTAEVSFKLGCLLRDEGDGDGALNLFEAVTRLDSSNVGNLLALGNILSERERWQDTARALSTAVLYQDQMDDGERLSLFKLLGRAREELGERDKATQMYRRALALAPQDDNVKKRLEQLRDV